MDPNNSVITEILECIVKNMISTSKSIDLNSCHKSLPN